MEENAKGSGRKWKRIEENVREWNKMQENGRESKRLEENRREWKIMQFGSVGSVLLSLCSMADFTGKWRKRYKTKILSNGNPA